MTVVLKREIYIRWGWNSNALKLPEGAVLSGRTENGFFVFQWRNVGEAQLPEDLFTVAEGINTKPLNLMPTPGAYKKGHKYSVGVKNANAKLNPEKVKEIKELLKAGYTHRQLAIKYRVSTGAISAVKSGRTWQT